MRDLPIFELEQEFLEQITTKRRVLVQAPTGSGKSTQLPQILLDHGVLGNGQVVVLQPRRLATRMLAARVAAERQVRLGEEVGYQIRFDDVSGPKTKIKFVTEGILLRRMLSDSSLKGVSTILFDEFHERHLYGDITLARALDLQETIRPDLKIAVMSATLSAESLEKYLQPCSILSSKGRTHPVIIEYLAKPLDLEKKTIWEVAAQEVERLMNQHPSGDALVFMPGSYEIHRTIQAIQNTRISKNLIILPLHGELLPVDQDAAVARYNQKKVIVATNVAETSLTIDGVTLVIDSGLAKIARYDPYRGINTLLTEKISHSSADQRAGRAGRTAPGHCLRLWTQKEHVTRPFQESPEVKRLDLSEVVLTLKASGIEDIKKFRWLESPESRSLERAETLLKDLGALDSKTSSITSLGRQMLSFPLHPRYSRMLLAAKQYGCVRPIALIAALTQGRNLWLRSSSRQMDADREDLFGQETESDFFILMRAWRYADKNGYDLQKCKRLGIHSTAARQVKPLFDYFLKIAQNGASTGGSPQEGTISNEAIQKCLLVGFSDQLAKRYDSGTLRCRLVHGRSGSLAKESVVQQSSLIVAGEVREIEGKDEELRVLLSLVTAVKLEWLRELFPNDFSERQEVSYDPTLRRVFAIKEMLFRDLVLESKKSENPSPERAAQLLAQEVLAGRCILKYWDDSVEQWILRVHCLRKWCPEFNLPEITEEIRCQIIQKICLGATSYKEIKEKLVWPTLKSWLSAEQQKHIDQCVPERISLPNGRTSKITYNQEKPPTISVRIQDLYGVHDELKITKNRIPLVIQILAPNHRPIQVTQNLSSFWKNDYPKIKRELERKYPKHEWK